MTTETMDEIAEAFADGIRQMPVVKDHPEWWIFLSGDGFKAHIKSVVFQKVGLWCMCRPTATCATAVACMHECMHT